MRSSLTCFDTNGTGQVDLSQIFLHSPLPFSQGSFRIERWGQGGNGHYNGETEWLHQSVTSTFFLLEKLCQMTSSCYTCHSLVQTAGAASAGRFSSPCSRESSSSFMLISTRVVVSSVATSTYPVDRLWPSTVTCWLTYFFPLQEVPSVWRSQWSASSRVSVMWVFSQLFVHGQQSARLIVVIEDRCLGCVLCKHACWQPVSQPHISQVPLHTPQLM